MGLAVGLPWLRFNPDDLDCALDASAGIALRKAEPVFRRQKYFQGRSIRGEENVRDVAWIGTDGRDVNDEVWNAGFIRCVGLRLDGKLIGEVNEHGEPIEGDTVLLLLNAHHEDIRFILPAPVGEANWEPLMDPAQFPGQLSQTEAARNIKSMAAPLRS